MILHYHEPPPIQRTGGLDAAIRSLQQALEERGHTVAVNPSQLQPPPTVAHFHGLWQPAFGKVARAYRAASVPFVVSPHGMLEPWAWRHKWWKKFPYWHFVEKRWARSASCLLATGESEARRLRTFLPRTKVEVLPLGLTGTAQPAYAEARAQLGWAPDERILLFLSRIHEKKGLDLLLAAASALGPAQTGKSRMVIVGPEEQPDYARRCRDFAQAHADELPPVEWTGPQWGEERWRYLQGADLLCLPTHSENFGLVVLEALQVGTPVLTTNQTPWGETLPTRGGYIASPNEPSIREALQKFLRNDPITPLARTELAEWTNRTFSWTTLGERYEAMYSRQR